MVYCEGNQSPVKKHDLLADALCEANRLAHKQPGENFYVLESMYVISGNVTITSEAIT